MTSIRKEGTEESRSLDRRGSLFHRITHQPLIDLIVARVAGPRPELRSEYEDLLFRCLPIGGYSADQRQLLHGIAHEFVDYRQTGMEQDLRRYLFFLESGHYPLGDETLPTWE